MAPMESCPRGKWPSVGSAGGGGLPSAGVAPGRATCIWGRCLAWIELLTVCHHVGLPRSPEQCQTPSHTIARLTYIITLHTELLTQGMADCHKLTEGATEFRWKEILKNLCNEPARIWQA